MVYYFLLLGATWDCSRLQRLPLFPGGTDTVTYVPTSTELSSQQFLIDKDNMYTVSSNGSHLQQPALFKKSVFLNLSPPPKANSLDNTFWLLSWWKYRRKHLTATDKLYLFEDIYTRKHLHISIDLLFCKETIGGVNFMGQQQKMHNLAMCSYSGMSYDSYNYEVY